MVLINKNGNVMSENIFVQYDTIIFYGASTRNKKIIDRYGIGNRIKYVVDRNESLWGEYIDGYIICSKEVLTKEKNMLIVTALAAYAQDIIESTKQYVKCELIFYLPEEGTIKNIIIENEKVIQYMQSPKYIHFFPDEKFLVPFYTMLETHFNIREHLFIVDYARLDLFENQYRNFAYANRKNKKNQNIMFMKDFGYFQNIIEAKNNCNEFFMSSHIDNLFNEAQKIILHSVAFCGNFLRFIQSKIKRGYGSKMLWICWGGDIYFAKDSFVATEILNKINYGIAPEKRIDVILQKSLIPMKVANEALYAYLVNNTKIKDNENSITAFDAKKQLNILLGHYADRGNNLEYGLDIMYKFRDKNIKIYCTLSYGDERYREIIIKKGKEMYGDKFVPILDYMELEQYWEFLESIQVVIFPMVRMAAGTTLSYLNLLGKKIYMMKEIANIYQHLGRKVDDIEKINKQSWEEFVNCSRVEIADDAFAKTNDKIVSYWKRIL